jgi:hypothetical protein
VMRVGVGGKPVHGKGQSRSQPMRLLLSCCEIRLHDLRFPSSEASLAPLSKVRLEFSYLEATAHVLACTCPAITTALVGVVLAFLLIRLQVGSWALLLRFPVREPESGFTF